MISLIAPGRVTNSSKVRINGFCLVPGMHCQQYNDQHPGLIFHQTFKGSLRDEKMRKNFPARQITTTSTALVCSEEVTSHFFLFEFESYTAWFPGTAIDVLVAVSTS